MELQEALTSQRDQKQLPLLTPSEINTLIAWNNTNAPYPNDKTIHQLFMEQVQKTPDAIAVQMGLQQLTYRELNIRANNLAHHLINRNIDTESIVALSLERSIEMIIGILAILKANAVYLPIDPSFPDERITYMLNDCNDPIILSLTKHLKHVEKFSRKIICIDTFENESGFENINTPPIVTVTPINLAYILYTSGTTGNPKGVMCTHKGLVNRIYWMQQQYQLTSDDRVLQKTPLNFDVSLWEVFWPLCFGAPCVIAPPEVHKIPETLAEIIQKYNISVVHFVPSLLSLFLQTKKCDACNSLRLVFSSGEALTYELQQRFFTKLSAQLHNLYGPTEAAIDVTYWQCQADRDDKKIPIGKPIHNVQCHILDADLNPVPIGFIGELYISGDCLARGYLNQPVKTDESFIQHNSLRLYRTGDFCSYREDGNLLFHGRKDRQIKLRGYRIELAEIEETLHLYPDVIRAIVIIKEEPQPQLILYFTASKRLSKYNLENHCRQFLPVTMLPNNYIQLDEFPLLANGKIDMQTLREIVVHQPNVKPRNNYESLLSEIWQSVLGLDHGVNANFWQLGGNSILAIQIISKINAGFNIHLQLDTLFKYPTINELSTYINKLASCNTKQNFSIQKATSNTLIPCSHLQKSFYLAQMLSPEMTAYHNVLALKLEGPLNTKSLENALQETVNRHAILRTSFTRDNTEIYQIIHDNISVQLSIDNATNIEQFIQQEIQKSLPLDSPPWRFTLCKLNEANCLFIIIMHHIISDADSFNILLSEISHTYNALQAQTISVLPELAVQYADFSKWQHDNLSSHSINSKLLTIKNQLGNLTNLDYPIDFKRPLIKQFVGKTIRHQILDDLKIQVHQYAIKLGVTPFLILFSVFAILINRNSDKSEFTIGVPVNLRTQPELHKLIGLFINTLIINCKINRDFDFETILANQQDVIVDAYAHQDIPFNTLVEAIPYQRSLNQNPFFQIMFTYNHAYHLPNFNNLYTELLPINTEASKFDFSLTVTEMADAFELSIQYDTALFEEATMEIFLNDYITLTEKLLNNPKIPIKNISLHKAR